MIKQLPLFLQKLNITVEGWLKSFPCLLQARTFTEGIHLTTFEMLETVDEVAMSFMVRDHQMLSGISSNL
jgi:hypothetical protein